MESGDSKLAVIVLLVLTYTIFSLFIKCDYTFA